LSYQEFSNREIVAFISEEVEKTKDQERWYPYGNQTKPKEEEVNASLENLDQALCFVSSNYSKKEIIPLLRFDLFGYLHLELLFHYIQGKCLQIILENLLEIVY